MAKPERKNPLKHLRAADARATAKLPTEATRGVTRMVEGAHQSVLGTLGMSGREKQRTGGLTGLVYQSIHGMTQLVGNSVDLALGKLQPLLEATEHEKPGTPEREAVLAALNGVMGDRLAASDNPFTTIMSLRYRGKPLAGKGSYAVPDATGKIVVLVHGLCMNDLQWQTRAGPDAPVVDHGAVLAERLGYTPVYLRYNTGRHTSENGRDFAAILEQLLAHWPVPVSELSIVVHSMGGLVTRSACHIAERDGMAWRGQLASIVFLGTPHHGSPLEQAGNWIDVILGSTPYSAPFAKLGQLRSAGITDLRHGHVRDEDWQGHDRFARKPDSRHGLPLPAGVACYTLAATTASQRSCLADRLVGDGLVPLNSALGKHDDPKHSLAFARTACAIAYRTHHMELLSKPEVSEQIVDWLQPAGA